MERSEDAPDALNLYDLIDKGRRLRDQGDRRVEARSEQVSSSDIFTLIYTSGTTGSPKGVMLTHANVISQLENCPVRFVPDDRMLSILPIWHIAERVFEMVAMRNGCCTYYSNVRNFRQDLQTVKPTFIGSAPRLWESLFQTIRTTVGKSSVVRRSLFHTAYFLAHQVRGSLRRLQRHEAELASVSWQQRWLTSAWSAASLVLCGIPHIVLDRVILQKIRQSLGGQLKGSISGAGALPGYVDLFFNNLGIPVLEAYGMTETSPLISTRTFGQPVLGTVGPVYPETELRLVDIESGQTIHPASSSRGKKGEIHVRGPQVMQGYYKDPEGTDKVLRDGWLNTGDLGLLTFNDCLKLVGRSKDTIVLSNGENVEPVPIENKLLECRYIAQCMVVGQDRKFLTVLVVPDQDQLSEYGGAYEAVCRSEQAKALILTDIKRLVSDEQGFKSFERVSACYLVPKPFEVGDELTNLLKLRRNIVTARYAAEIDGLYATT
jgi:long-chain acyl-CoA synthetase